jgi:hypothetical protein
MSNAKSGHLFPEFDDFDREPEVLSEYFDDNYDRSPAFSGN